MPEAPRGRGRRAGASWGAKRAPGPPRPPAASREGEGQAARRQQAAAVLSAWTTQRRRRRPRPRAAAAASAKTQNQGRVGSARATVAPRDQGVAAAASTIAAPAVTTAPRTLLPPLVSRGNSKKRPRPASASPPHNGASPRTGASAVDTVRPAATSATKALANKGALLSSQRRYNTSDRAPLNKAASVVDRPILRMVSRRQSAGQLW